MPYTKQQPSRIEQPRQLDGDPSFIGVDMRHKPHLVQQGMVSFARNARFDKGVVETRPGIKGVKWGLSPALNFPINFPVSFTNYVGLGTIYGSCVFADPNGMEWILMATDVGTYAMRENYGFVKIELPDDVTISNNVFFVQCFDRVLMFRGENLEPLVWQALQNNVPPYISPWQYISQTPFTAGDGTQQIPNAATGAYMANRLIVPFERDQIACSDILDYTRFQDITEQFRINSGTDDNLVLVYPFAQQNLICFKSRSISLVTGFANNLSGIAQQVITKEHGLVSNLAVTNVGNDVWFLSDNGIYSIQQVLDNNLQGQTEPLSASIQPLIDRINWKAASGACAGYANNKFYIAVPLDNSTYNNIIIVYDFVNGAWSGYDDGELVSPQNFFKAQYKGRESLYFVNRDGILCVYEIGLEDRLVGASYPIEFEVITRGFTCNLPTTKKFKEAHLDIETWNPQYTINVIQPGVTQEYPNQTNVEKSRAKYDTYGVPPHELHNYNDDFTNPNRQDYSICLSDGGGTVVNNPPYVNAGSNRTITTALNTPLYGVVTDDHLLYNTPVITWTCPIAPAGGTATFADNTNPTTTVTVNENGAYTLQLSAFDGQYTTNSTVVITFDVAGVIPPPSPFLPPVTPGPYTAYSAAGDPTCIAVTPNYVYVGGSFYNWGGYGNNRLQRFFHNGSVDTSFAQAGQGNIGGGFNNEVVDVVNLGESIFLTIGANNNNQPMYNGTNCAFIVKLNLTGTTYSLDTTFSGNLNSIFSTPKADYVLGGYGFYDYNHGVAFSYQQVYQGTLIPYSGGLVACWNNNLYSISSTGVTTTLYSTPLATSSVPSVVFNRILGVSGNLALIEGANNVTYGGYATVAPNYQNYSTCQRQLFLFNLSTQTYITFHNYWNSGTNLGAYNYPGSGWVSTGFTTTSTTTIFPNSGSILGYYPNSEITLNFGGAIADSSGNWYVFFSNVLNILVSGDFEVHPYMVTKFSSSGVPDPTFCSPYQLQFNVGLSMGNFIQNILINSSGNMTLFGNFEYGYGTNVPANTTSMSPVQVSASGGQSAVTTFIAGTNNQAVPYGGSPVVISYRNAAGMGTSAYIPTTNKILSIMGTSISSVQRYDDVTGAIS